VAEVAYVSTAREGLSVKIVVEAVYVIMGRKRDIAKTVEVVDCVFMTRGSTHALNANGLKGELISSV
jgi:hypothetical protein